MDPPPSPFVKQLLLDLRDAVRSLRHDKASLQCQLQDAERRIADLQCALDDPRREYADLQGAYGDAPSRSMDCEDAVVHGRRDVRSLETVLVGRISQLEERMFLFRVLLCCFVVIATVLWLYR